MATGKLSFCDLLVSGVSCFLDQGHNVLVGVASGSLVDVVFETSWSCAVIFSGCEYGLPLESVSSTRMCVGWLTVADLRPGPLA